jgi:hypothetical protein
VSIPPDPPHPRPEIRPVRKVRRRKPSGYTLPLGCHPLWREIQFSVSWNEVPVNQYVIFIWGSLASMNEDLESRLGLKLDEETVLTHEGPMMLGPDPKSLNGDDFTVAVGNFLVSPESIQVRSFRELDDESIRSIKRMRSLHTPEGW